MRTCSGGGQRLGDVNAAEGLEEVRGSYMHTARYQSQRRSPESNASLHS